MNLRSPLGAAMAHGSARSGTGHWWDQRLGAVALVPLGLWFLGALLTRPDLGYAGVAAWIAEPLTAVPLALFTLFALWHSLLGTAVIIEDYVHGHGLKAVTLLALQLVHGLAAAAAIVALVAIVGGGAR